MLDNSISLSEEMPTPKIEFLLPCELGHRIQVTKYKNAPDVPNKLSFVCNAISEGAGKIIFTQPRMCAKCQRKGAVDPVFLIREIEKYLGIALTHAANGFYDKEDLKTVVRIAYKTHKTNLKGRNTLRKFFEVLVGTGKMPLEEAETFITEHLPEILKDESLSQTPEERSAGIRAIVEPIRKK